MKLQIQASYIRNYVLSAYRDLTTRPTHNYISSIDGLRVFATLWVSFYHFLFALNYYMQGTEFENTLSNPIMRFFTLGHFAVDVFFVICGFLIGYFLFHPLKSSGTFSVRTYYIKRFLRIVPVSYFFLISCLMVTQLIDFKHLASNASAWPNFLFINNFFSWQNQFLPWTWSLAVEEQVYLIAPLFIYILRKSPRAILATLGTLFFASFLFRYEHAHMSTISLLPNQNPLAAQMYFDQIYTKTQTRYVGIVIGLIVAHLWTFHRDFLMKLTQGRVKGLAALALSVAAILYSIYPLLNDPNTNVLSRFYITSYRGLFSLGVAGFLILLIVEHPWLSKWNAFLSHAKAYPLAQLTYSYSLFNMALTHLILFCSYQMHWAFLNNSRPMLFIFAAILSLAQSLLVFLFIEHPLRRWRSRMAPQLL